MPKTNVRLSEKSGGRGKESRRSSQKGNIGGHIDPKQSGKNPEAEAKQRLATERRLAQDLAALQAETGRKR